jgi:hypothetical protein
LKVFEMVLLVSGYPVKKKILFFDCEAKYAWIYVNEQGHAVDTKSGEPDVAAQRKWEQERKNGLIKIPRLFNSTLSVEQYRELGVNFVVAYSLWDNASHVFMPSQLDKLEILMQQAEEIVGFMSFRFDDHLLAAHGVRSSSTYDFALEARRMALFPFKGGYGDSLSTYAELNLGMPRPASSSGFGYFSQFAKKPNKRKAYLKELVIDASTGDLTMLMHLYLLRHRVFVPNYVGQAGKHILVTLPEFAEVTHEELRKVEAGEVPDWYCGNW